MRRPATAALVAGCVVLAIGAVIHVIPWLTKQRTLISSIPGPAPLSGFTPIALGPGHTVCATNVVVDTDAGSVAMPADSGRRSGPPLRVTASGPGHRSAPVAPGGLKGKVTSSAPLRAPSRSLVGRICLRNDGRVVLRLLG